MSLAWMILAAALAQQAPGAPAPFPRPAAQQPTRPGGPPAVQPVTPPSSATTAPVEGAPPESALGVPLYPGAQFLASYDAGRGQRFYLYGSTASFAEIVGFYRTALKQRGDMVFDAPATHQFDVGRFREETMAFPSGVTIKDFQSQVSQGYPNPRLGGEPARFPTVIQIIPATNVR